MGLPREAKTQKPKKDHGLNSGEYSIYGAAKRI